MGMEEGEGEGKRREREGEEKGEGKGREGKGERDVQLVADRDERHEEARPDRAHVLGRERLLVRVAEREVLHRWGRGDQH